MGSYKKCLRIVSFLAKTWARYFWINVTCCHWSTPQIIISSHGHVKQCDTGTASNPKREVNIYFFSHIGCCMESCIKQLNLRTTPQSLTARAMIWLLWDLETDTGAVCKWSWFQMSLKSTWGTRVPTKSRLAYTVINLLFCTQKVCWQSSATPNCNITSDVLTTVCMKIAVVWQNVIRVPVPLPISIPLFPMLCCPFALKMEAVASSNTL